MALPTFNPPVGPSPGTSVTRDVKIFEAEFGDGYSQPTPGGLNHIKKKLSLNWAGVTEGQMHIITDFFTERGGTKPFYYKPAGHHKALKWTCAEWSETLDGGVWKITAELVQSFTAEI